MTPTPDQREAHPAKNSPAAVDVSILVPCRNEVDYIDACIASILGQGLEGTTIEILVADGASDDGTRERLDDWGRRDERIRVVDNPSRIVPTGLNRALAAAQGDVVIRMDVHARYPSNYIRSCLAALARTGADNVGGVVITRPSSESFPARVVQAVSTHPFGVGGARFRTGAQDGPTDTVPFGCFRRELFRRIGAFDERLVRNQDYEFNARIRASGGTVWLDPEIHAEYFNQPTFAGLLRQARFTGRWNAYTWHLAPYTFRFRHVVPGAFLIGLVAGALGTWAWPPLAWVYLAVLVLYLGLAVTASIQQSARAGISRLAIVLPAAFFLYHVAYGWGILHGAVSLLAGTQPYGKTCLPWPGAPAYRVCPERRGSGA